MGLFFWFQSMLPALITRYLCSPLVESKLFRRLNLYHYALVFDLYLHWVLFPVELQICPLKPQKTNGFLHHYLILVLP
jgi:hypothetical protein